MAEHVSVTISRHWHSPQIQTTISGDGIAIAITWDAAIEALTQELLREGRWLTESQLRTKVQSAATLFISKVKEESQKAV